MGKSVDLPEDLESASSQPLGNADDLLAQLAGDEVDRLLAEAEADGREQPPAAGSPAAQKPAQQGPAIQDQLDALFSEISTEQPKRAAQPAPAAPAAGDAVAPIGPASSKLPDDIDADAVMAALIGDPPPPLAAPGAATPPPAPAPKLIVEVETSAAERQGLADPDPADELPGPGELQALAAPVEDDRPLPVYLKPLEWLSAPLDLLPPAVRDVLGQVAILTLVNAIAVLIYVFVFRRP